jgi:predicted MFS family arabinose efflux permease
VSTLHIGPTLPALRENVGVSFERLGVMFLARWVGGVAGSILGGWLLDRAPGSHVPYAVGRCTPLTPPDP